MFDGIGVAVESGDDEDKAKEIADDDVEVGDDEVAGDVEGADVIDGFAPLRAEVLDVLGCDEVAVGVLKYVSVLAALAQARYE